MSCSDLIWMRWYQDISSRNGFQGTWPISKSLKKKSGQHFGGQVWKKTPQTTVNKQRNSAFLAQAHRQYLWNMFSLAGLISGFYTFSHQIWDKQTFCKKQEYFTITAHIIFSLLLGAKTLNRLLVLQFCHAGVIKCALKGHSCQWEENLAFI